MKYGAYIWGNIGRLANQINANVLGWIFTKIFDKNINNKICLLSVWKALENG